MLEACRGPQVDFAAPGSAMVAAALDGTFSAVRGTSFAAPFITAIVASIYKHALLPAISDGSKPRIPESVTLAHLSTEKIVRDDTIGLGLVTAPSDCAAGRRKAPHELPIATLKRWETRVLDDAQPVGPEAFSVLSGETASASPR